MASFVKHVLSVSLGWAALLNVVLPVPARGTPCIIVTNLPAFGTTDNLSGIVLEANPAATAVAVFIYVPGYGWVTKPTCAQPLSVIQSNGSWSADITTGGSDAFATRVAALLVGTNFSDTCIDGLEHLPTNLYAQAMAKTIVTRPQPGVRFLQFSGYNWWVKKSAGPVGPGPNYFSDGTNNVWVDANGWLHLRVTNRSNEWQCAEIVSARTFGPGHYRFEMNSPADSLNERVTLGLFTWSDDPAYAYREIDVECARWNNPADTNNAQFVVQPYDQNGHLARYRVPPDETNSTHFFIWETNRITFAAQTGSYSPMTTNAIASWAFTNAPAVPQSGDENVRLNLWLVQGQPPSDSNEVEVVIKNFNFVPLDPPQGAVLERPEWMPDGTFQFDLQTRPDFRYMVQRSTNLGGWTQMADVLATNTLMTIKDTNLSATGESFYRAITVR